jgi:1-acyl-sn-glycerol-3-phosphate acyltransferase
MKALVPVLRATAFWLGMAAFTLAFAPLTLLTLPFSPARRFAFVSLWARCMLWWLGASCGLRHRVRGLEHLPAGNGIVLCKHQSAWETMALQCYFRPQCWVLKRELLWIPLFGWGLAMLRPIAIDRASGRAAMEQLLEQGLARLRDGIWVVVFPEGTRTAIGQRVRYKPGGALLAEKTGYPVIPVAHNAGLFWPRRGFVKKPGVIELVIGPPIETQGRSALEINAAAEQWIEAECARMHTATHAEKRRTPGEQAVIR